MQCLMCVADHLANAQENWRAMCRVPDYARSIDGSESHLCDFRGDICQAEYQSWKDWPDISKQVREIKLLTSEIFHGGDVVKCEASHNIFGAIRKCWEHVMTIRQIDDGIAKSEEKDVG